MFRGDLGGKDKINDIPIMRFSNLNAIINERYPGYRNKASYFSLAKFAGGGSMSLYDFANGFYRNINSSIFGEGNYADNEIIVLPPAYENKINLPVKNI